MTLTPELPSPDRLLVVGLDADTATAICKGLTRAGFVVTTADQPDEVVETACENRADLVLIALDGPGLDGLDLLARVKRAAPATPVLMLGGADGSPEVSARVLDLGADDVIEAPFHPTIVRRRVEAVLERRALHDSVDTGLQKLVQLSHDLQDVILPIAVSLSTEKNTDRLLERILFEAKDLCRADAATLYVRTKDDRLKFSIMRTDSLGIALGGMEGGEIPFAPLRLTDPDTGAPNDRNVATHAALHGIAVNIADIYGTDAFDFAGTREFDQRSNYRSISTLTVPLMDNADQVIAVLQLLNAVDPVTGQVTAFDSYQQLVVESLASQAAVVFKNQLLVQRQEDLLKFERDLQIGRQIQAGFLPEELPTPAGYQVSARFLPAREVAGDFYDAFMVGPETMAFIVADVCDKGVGAALFMALVRSLVRVYTQQRYAVLSEDAMDASRAEVDAAGELGDVSVSVTGRALQQALILTNDYIGDNHLNMNMFATMFAGMLNVRTGSIACVNGGHNAPILRTQSGSTIRLPSKSPAIGMMPGFQFEVMQARMDPGDLLIVFSDGIPDARDPHGRFFTEARLLHMAEAVTVETPAERVAADIQEALTSHISTAAQFDDITMMIIRREATL